jgi:glycosyltransferase involved in cell wall biosynthesis
LDQPKNLIIDFNASKRYSHHWSLLQQYQRFLELFRNDYEIWIPENAHKDVVAALGGHCHPFLKSNYHGYERNQNFFKWIINKIIDVSFKFIKNQTRWKEQNEIIKSVVALYYIHRPYKKIKKMIKLGHRVTLIFPSTDSLAVRLMAKCLKSGLDIDRASLRLAPNYKDSLNIDDMELTLQKLVNDFPKCHFAFGFETFTLGVWLKSVGMGEKNLFWSPAPPVKKLDGKTAFSKLHQKTEAKIFTFGFLGAARPGKGFDEIPKLISQLTHLNFPFEVIIQQAVFSWPEYEIAMHQLKTYAELIHFLPPDISQDHLESIFEKIDALVLPYNEKDYKLAGSALFFKAAEYGIPTISKNGVAFAWDIDTYQLGYIYANSEEFTEKIKFTISDSKAYGFDLYNHDRMSAIKLFLGI